MCNRFFKAWTCRLAISSIPYFHFSFGIYSDESTESTLEQTSSSVTYMDSDDSLSDEERVPELYQGNPSMSMYASGKTDNLSFDKVLDLLTEDHKLSELCRVQPMGVQRNSSFLIDLTSVKLTDLPCDDNGSYKGSGTHTWTYRIEDCNGRRQKSLVAKKRQDLRNDTSIVYLIRKYRTNMSCNSFKQIISYAEDAKGNVINNIALVQYNFQGDEKSFEVGCHGNKKKDTSVPFLPTNQTTKEQIKKFTRENKPKKAMAKLSKENDLLTANASASTVRDMTQIYNMRRQEKEKERQREGVPDEKVRKDKLYSVMLMAAQESGDEKFTRGIAAWPEPICVLGCDYQFKDIARFCCREHEAYPLGLDTTFNLGEFYVTPTSYKNLLLYNVRDGKPPLFIGPTLVHMTRGYSAYCHLASKLKEEEPDIGDIRSLVTDGEAGLLKALKVFYPHAVKLRCTKHFKENVKDKLKALTITGEDATFFISAVFGCYLADGIYTEGLIDSSDDETFDALLSSVEEIWNEKEEEACQSGTEPKFHRWIKQHSSMIKESMIKDKRVMAGLQPEEQITTNGAESANHVLKEAAEYEEMSLAEFVALCKSIAKNQQQEIIRAILRKGW